MRNNQVLQGWSIRIIVTAFFIEGDWRESDENGDFKVRENECSDCIIIIFLMKGGMLLREQFSSQYPV